MFENDKIVKEKVKRKKDNIPELDDYYDDYGAEFQ
jgi:hypothetical protein